MFLYQIEKTAPGLVISIRGTDLKPLAPFKADDILKKLSDKDEKSLIIDLLNEELAYQKNRYSTPPHFSSALFSEIHISPQNAVVYIKRIGERQKLYFKDKQLVVDSYVQVDFYYKIRKTDANSIHIEGRLKWRSGDISLAESDYIGQGRQHWFIKGIALRFIQTPICWKDFSAIPETLQGLEKDRFLAELSEDDIEAIFEGDKMHATEPHPILILKDRVGACADLWIDYGGEHCYCFHDQHSMNKERNHEAEKRWEVDFLETNYIKKAVGNAHYYCPVDQIGKSLTFLLEIGWKIKDWQGKWIVRQSGTDLSADEAGQYLVVKGKIAFNDFEADLKDVVGAFNRRERFVQLSSTEVGLLPEQTTFNELMHEGELVSDGVQLKKSCYGALLDFDEIKISGALEELKNGLRSFKSMQTIEPSEKFIGKLRPYQQQGVNWIHFLYENGFGGILADDMGLGKTVQLIAFLATIKSNLPHLIVVPTTLLFNWRNEIERFFPDANVVIHHGPRRNLDKDQLLKQSIILTSYGTLKVDSPLFAQIPFQTIILDEAQTIKNADTLIARTVKALQGHFKLSITGTPIENHLKELWSHFYFLLPELLGDEETFEKELESSQLDSRYLKRIKKKVQPFILRRKKEEVAVDLPSRVDQTVYIEMDDNQRAYYDGFLVKARTNLLKKVTADGIQKHRMEVLETILRLRQICAHPLLVCSGDEEPIVNSAKWDYLFLDLETIIEEKKKVLIYSQFTSMLQLMAKEAKSRCWNFSYLDGSTSNREKEINHFQENSEISLFFISLKAGGVGLNLTAADYVLLYDPWWNDAAEEQAINRAHRIGRKESVLAKRYIMVESIEEKMMKLKEAKKFLIDHLFDERSGLTNLSEEDLINLLN